MKNMKFILAIIFNEMQDCDHIFKDDDEEGKDDLQAKRAVSGEKQC